MKQTNLRSTFGEERPWRSSRRHFAKRLYTILRTALIIGSVAAVSGMTQEKWRDHDAKVAWCNDDIVRPSHCLSVIKINRPVLSVWSEKLSSVTSTLYLYTLFMGFGIHNYYIHFIFKWCVCADLSHLEFTLFGWAFFFCRQPSWQVHTQVRQMSTKTAPEEVEDRVLKVLRTYDKISMEKVQSLHNNEWNGKLQQLKLIHPNQCLYIYSICSGRATIIIIHE